ncbi:MAG: hypothetical protein DYG89_07395 [Caldilinea sp. CFX5]|nr:hypothetical protein [Caldilinea sp. CFX5]
MGKNRFQSSKLEQWMLLGWGVALVAHLLLFSPVPLLWRTAAATIILAFTPGLFLVLWVMGRDKLLTAGEILLYGWTAGYALWIWGILFLSYLPGGLSQFGVLLAFDLLALLFCGLALYKTNRGEMAEPNQPTVGTTFWLGLLVLLAVAIFLRFTNLNYAEFQGDEAKVMLPAAALLQGQEEVLLTYRKGPTEIVIPAGQLALVGEIDEGAARAPFTFGNILCLLAVFGLGWRLFGGGLGALAGWLAAMLLALDGYFIGLTRIVQYQSLIFLMGVFTLYPLVSLCFGKVDPPAIRVRLPGYLLLTALFAATSAVTHYEGFLVWLPALYLCWLLWRQPAVRRSLLMALLPALLLGGLLLAAFYLPFLRHPAFASTVERYSSDVVGQGVLLYNRLGAFAAKGVLYNTPVAFGLTLAGLFGGVLWLWARGQGRCYRVGLVVSGLCMAAAIAVANRTEMSEGAALVLFCIVGLVLLPPLVLPTVTTAERLLWWWLSLPLLIAAFLLEDPNTHFYIFYTPWMLLCGWVFANLWQRWRDQWGVIPARFVGVGLCLLFMTLFGGYAYLFFVYAPAEVVRHWRDQTILPKWLMWQTPQDHSLFGMPHYSGWEVVNQLYANDALEGSYLSNVRHWIPEWYIRNAIYCENNPDVVLIERLERLEEQAELHELMGDAYSLWGVIYAYDEPRLEIYRRAPAPPEVVQLTAPMSVTMPYTIPFEIASAELPPPTTPVNYRFGDQLALIGYRLPTTTVRVGERLPLVLVWQGLPALSRDYTLFAQLLDANQRKIGQLDTALSCNAGPTSEWQVGETMPGYYQIPIFPGESPGVYGLVIGLYDSQSIERLPLYAATGEVLGDALPLAQITVEP